jgi:hypothetical protein
MCRQHVHRIENGNLPIRDRNRVEHDPSASVACARGNDRTRIGRPLAHRPRRVHARIEHDLPGGHIHNGELIRRELRLPHHTADVATVRRPLGQGCPTCKKRVGSCLPRVNDDVRTSFRIRDNTSRGNTGARDKISTRGRSQIPARLLVGDLTRTALTNGNDRPGTGGD